MRDPDPRPSDPNLNLPIGGGLPPIVPGPSLADDEKALRKGNTVPMVLGAVAALGVGVALIVFLASGQPDPFETTGRQVNTIKRDHFDAFWGCALPNEPLGDLRSDRDLRYAIETRARSQPSRYAQHVRQQCLVKLNEHDAPLRALIPPPELEPQVAELGTSIAALRTAWGGYLEYLDHATPYDEDAAAPQLGKIAKGWYDYRRAHGQINTRVRERLDR
jgi:hypothetical protein